MRKEIPKSQAILLNKCPKCHKGDLFIKPNPYLHLSQMGKMYQRCPKCNLNYSPEPGFYFGAAYVSYALTTMVIIPLVIITFLLGARSFLTFLWVIGISILVTTPFLFRLSRSLWIHFFIKYDKKAN